MSILSPNFRVNIKWLWLVLLIALVLVAWQLSSLVQVDAFKVHAQVKDTPPGYAKATANRGSPPPGMVKIAGGQNFLYINTDIDFGTVFPGEVVSGSFTVNLIVDDDVDYTITLSENATCASDPDCNDIRPYILVQKIQTAGDMDDDPDHAHGVFVPPDYLEDYEAEGDLTDETDEFDIWTVTFYVPDVLGEYQAIIVIVPEEEITVD